MDFIGLVIARYGSASLTDNPAAFDPTAPTQGAEVLVPILHDVSAALAVLRDAPGGPGRLTAKAIHLVYSSCPINQARYARPSTKAHPAVSAPATGLPIPNVAT